MMPRAAAPAKASHVEQSLKVAKEKDIDDARTAIKEGDEVEVKITAIDRKKRTINLSIKAKETDDEQATVSEYAPESGGMAKLGDILKEQLDK